MEFWGVEVKAGEPIKVKPEDRNVIHLSQACLGEAKKAADSVVVYGKTNEQKLVLGHLIPGQIPQLNFDLVFHEEFELSHNWKNGSVHFVGYQTMIDDEDTERLGDESDESESEEETEELPVIPKQNGKVEKPKPTSTKNAVKPESSGKKKVKIEEPTKDDSDEDDAAADMDDETDSDDIMDSSDDDSEDESEDEDEETPTPKKPESKKRAQVSEPAKTPVSTKKAKIDATTPQKTDGKKGGHTDTPHPSKKGKTPATEKSKVQTPKSAGGDFSCGTCSKSFNSDGALQSHSKAKHGAGK